MEAYYAQRANEYEAIYHRPDPVRQQELRDITATMRQVLSHRRVLEVACGTGFWTALLANRAAQIVATDLVDETLEVARSKALLPNRVKFVRADAYRLDCVDGDFDAGLANFWLSHVPRARLDEFLRGFHERLKPGAAVFMADNMYVEGVGGQLISKEGSADTFKIRELADGSKHEVLKNYFDEARLRAIFGRYADDLNVTVAKCYWWVSLLIKN